MKTLLVLTILAVTSGTLPIEQQAAELTLSVEAGQVVSAADTCGYKLDTSALKAFMTGTIAALHDAARFNYYAVTTAFPTELEGMSSTAKTASCALQEELARRHGLLK